MLFLTKKRGHVLFRQKLLHGLFFQIHVLLHQQKPRNLKKAQLFIVHSDVVITIGNTT